MIQKSMSNLEAVVGDVEVRERAVVQLLPHFQQRAEPFGFGDQGLGIRN